MQFLLVVGVHITSLHLAVESGMLVRIGPVVVSAFFCNKTLVTISTFMNTVYPIYVHVSLRGFLKGLVTVFAFERAILTIGF